MTDGLTFQQISPADTAWARVVGQVRRIPLTLGAASFTVTISAPQPLAGGTVIRILAGETSLWVTISDWDALFRGCAEYEGVSLAALPAEIAPAVVEAAAASMLDLLSKQTGLPWTILEVQSGARPPHAWRLGLEIADTAGGVLRGNVAADDLALPLIEQWVRHFPAPRNESAPAPPLVVAVEIGMTSLTVDELRSLRLRDVLLMDVTAYLPEHQGVIRISPTSAWRVTAAEGIATLVEPRTTAPRVAAPADSPSVNVLFEAGDVTIPLDSLPTLTAGQTLALDNSETVRLSVEGVVIACGELVQLGGKLGVRVLQLGPSTAGS
jgi:type III secretion system YscQ/HrcQ family protein